MEGRLKILGSLIFVSLTSPIPVLVMSSTPSLVIGLGTGRCGTVSLSSLLNAQRGAFVTHEGYGANGGQRLLHWDGNTGAALAWVDELRARPGLQLVGDVAYYFLPYVEAILLAHPDARFVVLRRDQTETVNSYLRKTRGQNHWMLHDGIEWEVNPKWDPTYPKYETATKREALGLYWDEYYAQAESLAAAYPESVHLFETRALNTLEGRHAILSFLGIPEGDAVLEGTFHDNEIGGGTLPPHLMTLSKPLLAKVRSRLGSLRRFLND